MSNIVSVKNSYPSTAIVTAASPVHCLPDPTSDIVGTLQPGQIIFIIELTSKAWLLIHSNHLTGYVPIKHCQIDATQTEVS